MSDRGSVFFGAFMGVLLGFLADRAIEWTRDRDRRIKFLFDTRSEIIDNCDRLQGRGLRMITNVWDSGVSIGLLQNLSSEQVRRLSRTYHRIKANHAEAVICREAGELYRSKPKGPEKDQAHVRWVGLSMELEKRENNLKKALSSLITDKEFWKPLSFSDKSTDSHYT